MGFNRFFDEVKANAKDTSHEVVALFLAYKNHPIPLPAKIIAILVVGYALSPIDLIPDFIPVLGYLDDLILLPLGIALAIRLIPADIMAACRVEADTFLTDGKPVNRLAGFLIVLIWLMLCAAIAVWLLKP